MKSYLDYALLSNFIARYFPNRDTRLVGADRTIDSGYFDIIRFFGDEKADPENIHIVHLPDRYSFSNALIADFATEREKELKAAGRLYEGPYVTRVADAQVSGGLLSLTVQPCRYADQAGTCFALDWPDERFTGSLREFYKQTTRSSAFADIPFPLCFGVCGFLLVQNDTEPPALLLMHRSGKLASLEHSVGPSMAGAVDYDTDDATLLQMLSRSAAQEISEELLLAETEYQLISLAYAREIFRGERPQLFCLIVTELSSNEITERLQKEKIEKQEFTRFEWVELKNGALPDAQLQVLNHEAQMSYWLAQEYWSAAKTR